MKKSPIYLILLLGLLLCACSEDEEKLTRTVQDTVTRGAVLRTISVPSPTFDFNDPSKEWIVELEEQDHEDGALFASIDVYASLTESGTGETTDEALVKNIPATTFSIGPNALPRGLVRASLNEVLTAIGLQPGDYGSSDAFTLRLTLNLTDGRSFTNTDAIGTVTGGSFFSTPYAYSAQFFCALEDASLFDGNYIVVTDAWADYSAGDIVPVAFVSEYTFRILNTNNPFVDNTGSSYMEVTIDPETGDATVVSNECFNYPGFDCVSITGAGSVGTCTGDINLVNVYGPYGSNAFSLMKQ